MNNKFTRMTGLLLTILMLLVLALPQSIMAEPVQLNWPSCNYRTHVQNIGWQDWKTAGQTSGTFGQSLRLEAIEITVNDEGNDLGVEYQTHVQNIGWQELKYDGETSGTYGQSLRLEAIRIQLTGSSANLFDVYYRVHAQNLGWLGWAKNGDSAGSAGLSYRLEAIEIVVVGKGHAAPGSTLRPFVSVYSMGIAQTQEENYYDVNTAKWVYASRYERPVFYDNSLVQLNLSVFYEALENSWVQANNAELTTFINAYTTNPAFRQNLIGKYENIVNAAISYNNNNIISVTQDQYTYTGGAHGNSELTAHSFCTKTGDELTLGDIMAIPDNQISPKLTTEFQNLKNTDPRYADIDLTAIASKLNANSHYYLTDAGVCVYFNPYEVAYGAVGRVELIIPYTRTDLLADIETLI
ncbi:DUF4163 domain-containing protein [Acetobacterium paludosum]|uniref:DUF4163 domain-containing protein n=1 Tax=Acetobacterium paludosum TaxID=52693 RepID=A0A923KP74_9FIRM|nr:DUF3298 domain-containing protein [Acetobacterium paludosum]MBC3887854.1 DUF4163 domain-containing protein [Acetobacterium paludosum]